MATHEDKQMLRDANGDLIPQYWDIQDEEFKPLTGQDGAQDTRLTGSIVEFDIANQVEIRGDGSHLFDFEVPKDIKDFELIISDSHQHGDRVGKSFPLTYSFGEDIYNRGLIMALADDHIAYGWVSDIGINIAQVRRFVTRIPGEYGRDNNVRVNLTLTDMFLNSNFSFHLNTTEQEDTNFTDRLLTLNSLKKSILFNKSNGVLRVKLEGLEDAEDVRGSISIRFVGWY